MSIPATPGQTIGPFFGYALPYERDAELIAPGRGDAIRLQGLVLDGHGDPVPDALIELWQTRPDGSIPQETGSLHRDPWVFTGWGRASTDDAGRYSFTTTVPGPVRPNGPAFFCLTVFARGLLDRLFTRAYLPGQATDRDPFLASVPADRRSTLIASTGEAGFNFDVRLQGENETVFLTYPGHDG